MQLGELASLNCQSCLSVRPVPPGIDSTDHTHVLDDKIHTFFILLTVVQLLLLTYYELAISCFITVL